MTQPVTIQLTDDDRRALRHWWLIEATFDGVEHATGVQVLDLLDRLAKAAAEEASPVVVVTVRDPDASNDYKVWGDPKPVIIDVDLGYADLNDAGEFFEWACGQLDVIDALPPDHPAREYLTTIIDDQRERHGHEARWPTMDDLQREHDA